jgi:hypothetical protein
MIDSTEGMDESIAQFYTQTDTGQFILNVEGANGYELENTTNLKTALGKERANASEAMKKLKSYEGLDADQAREAMEKMAEMADFDPEKKVEEAMKARETQMLRQHEKAVSGMKEENSALLSQLEQNLITSAATKAIAESQGSVDLLLPHVARQTRMRRTESGNFIAEVVDTDGNPRIGDANGNPMTIPQLVDEMRASDSFARAFDGSGATGSGATNNTAPSGTAGRSRTISRFDQDSLNANIEAIASGEATIGD